MHRSYQLVPFILQASVLVTNVLALSDDQQSRIQWTGPCAVKNQTAPMICGTLDVPRDYTDSCPDKTVTLDIAKVAPIDASSDEKPESIILNFGGPGDDSLTYMASLGSQLQAYGILSLVVRVYLVRYADEKTTRALGGKFELVTFNPRFVCLPRTMSGYTNMNRAGASARPSHLPASKRKTNN